MPRAHANKLFWLSFGWVFCLLGFIGLLLPIMPTTPFMIVAAYCFSKGSPRLHQWLLNQKTIGPPLRLWEEKKVIPRRVKTLATILITCSYTFSIFFLKLESHILVIMGATLALVILFIWMQKSE